MRDRSLLIQLAVVFFSIGLFTIGGGYAMLPLIRQQVIQRRWLSEDDFIDGLVICQTCPGPLTTNIAVFVGMRVAGPAGAATATVAVALPAFLIMLGAARLITSYGELPLMQAAFAGAKPAIAALVTFVAINLGRRVLGHWRAFFTALGAALILTFTRVHPLVIIILVAMSDHLLHRHYMRRRIT